MANTTYAVPIPDVPPFANTTITGLPNPPAAVDNGARKAVESAFVQSQAYAQQALNQATSFLAQLSNAANSIAAVNTVSSALNKPQALNLASLDQLISARPTPITATTAPKLPTPGNLPPIPTTITVNPAPLPNMALIAGTLTAPYNSAIFTEAEYVAFAKSAMNVVLNWINGATTGIAPSVEQAIWERARTRENVGSRRKINDIVRQYASRGFQAPQGSMFVAMQSALQESQTITSTIARDVMIKQADLEQANRHFAMDIAVKYEQVLSDAWNTHMTRLLEDAKRIQSFIVDIFDKQVSLENMKTQRFGADIDARVKAFQTENDVSIAKLKADTDIYTAGVSSSTQLFTAQTQAEVDLFKAKNDVAIAAVRSDTDIYTAGTQVYGAKAQALTTEFKANIDAEIAAANLQIEASKANVQAMIQKATLLVESIRAGATVSAQLAASALSAVNMTAGISSTSSDQASNSNHYSFGISKGESSSISLSANTSDTRNYPQA